jgi:AraC family transcriptional regulator
VDQEIGEMEPINGNANGSAGGVASNGAVAQNGAMAKSVAAASLGMDLPARGFTIQRKVIGPGVTEATDLPYHSITLHAGAPVRVSCVRSGRSYVAQLTRGDLEIVPKGDGGYWVDEGPADCLIMRIDPGFLNKVAIGLGLNPATLEVLPRVQARDPQLEHLGWALEAAMAEGKAVEPLFVQGLGVALATRLIKEHSVVRPARVRRALTRRQTTAVCDHIEANLSGSLTLADLAPVAGVSASHFKALFKASVGVPAHRYVVRRRVVRAVDLIKTGKMPLAQIALETGFAHQSHMARAMRAVLGRTPGELAREYR